MPKHREHAPRPIVTMSGHPTTTSLPLAERSWIRTTAGRGAVTVALLGALGVGGTLAGWVDDVQIGVEVGTGSLDIAVDGQQGPIDVPLTLPDGTDRLAPGDTLSTTINVENPGTLPAVVTTNLAGLGATSLGAQLDATLTATPSGAPVLTKGGKANGASLDAFTIAPGGTVPLRLDLSLPANTGNEWQNKDDKLTLTLTAVQE